MCLSFNTILLEFRIDLYDVYTSRRYGTYILLNDEDTNHSYKKFHEKSSKIKDNS